MTARIDPAQLCSSAPLHGLPAMARRPPRAWRSLPQADQVQLASTLAEMGDGWRRTPPRSPMMLAITAPADELLTPARRAKFAYI